MHIENLDKKIKNQAVIIRKENPDDYHATELMTMRAFWNIHCPGCSEHYLVSILRNSKDYLPEYSRVAELDGKIVGAIFYSKAKIVEENGTVHNLVTFGPLAVEPTLQNSGIGRMLLEETFELLKKDDIPGIIIFGEKDYYPKVGFKHIKPFGITDPEGNTWDAMMACVLNADTFSKMHGKFYESPDFEKCEDESAIAEFEKQMPPYEKVKLQEDFMIIGSNRIGKIKSIEADGKNCVVQFWELEIEAVIDSSVEKKAAVGDVVLFQWKKDCKSVVVKICENLI